MLICPILHGDRACSSLLQRLVQSSVVSLERLDPLILQLLFGILVLQKQDGRPVPLPR